MPRTVHVPLGKGEEELLAQVREREKAEARPLFRSSTPPPTTPLPTTPATPAARATSVNRVSHPRCAARAALRGWA
jgi:hypothetical protein